MGLLDDLERDACFYAAINASRDEIGKPDPYKAAGIVMGMGYGYSLHDAATLGAMLGREGAFNDKEDEL
ncbi:MAG: hypothetical protein IJU35_08320 [Paludibacteraceae bacterium]|nr:hypothetical protein [Paludibacteraceae bacterium]